MVNCIVREFHPSHNLLVARNPLALLYLYDIIQIHSSRMKIRCNEEVELGSEIRD